MKYFIPFLVSFAAAVIFIVAGIYVGKKIKWTGREAIRHIHQRGVVRLGGIAMIMAFNAAILLNRDLVITYQLWGVIIASWLIIIVGTWDDLRELLWKTQLFYQVAITVLVFFMGVRIYSVTNIFNGKTVDLNLGLGVLFSLIIVLVWMVVMINAMNWLDGIDGLSGGVTFIGALTIFFLSLKPEVNQPPMAILAMILAGAAMGFLIFNFNPSRILAGTAGSMFMGFMLAVMAIFAGTKIATTLMVMAVPVIDFLWVIGERLREQRPIFKPDSNHLHHKLLKLGWSQPKINALFYLVTILISLVALNTRAIGKSITLLATLVIMAIFLVSIKKRIRSLEIK